MGLTNKDFKPSKLGLHAYDNTRRNVLGVIQLEISVDDFISEVEFHVLNITISSNLLLGRLWLHYLEIMDVLSSLHQKVQLGLANGTLTIHGDFGIHSHIADNALILENHAQRGGYHPRWFFF